MASADFTRIASWCRGICARRIRKGYNSRVATALWSSDAGEPHDQRTGAHDPGHVPHHSGAPEAACGHGEHVRLQQLFKFTGAEKWLLTCWLFKFCSSRSLPFYVYSVEKSLTFLM